MKILESRTLRFRSPAEFNDPFEFLPRRKNTTPVSDDEWASSEAWDFVLELSSACPYRVCCFSSEKDNMLMWSHYGDSHKGIAIGFQTKNAVFEDRLYEVTYSRERVAIELKRTVSPDKAEDEHEVAGERGRIPPFTYDKEQALALRIGMALDQESRRVPNDYRHKGQHNSCC
jgi:hypothetical protein